MDNLIGTDIILWDSLPQDTIGDLLTRKSKLTHWAEEQEQSWPATIPHQTFLSWGPGKKCAALRRSCSKTWLA
ncbi:MAG: hypothetical protein IPF93_17810 [Saprospiraceae bacterium]|nr:hypothetical protein [Saprospiraceae bacterium]